MPDYGLTLTGFAPKTFEVLRAEVNAALLEAISPTLDLSDGSVLGKVVAVVCERLAELWELAEAVAASQDPDAATGAALDALAALTGTTRRGATQSEVDLTLTGDDGTDVPAGSQASVDGAGDVFATTEDATLALVPDWATLTTYAAGDDVKSDGSVWRALNGAESGPDAPTGDGPTFDDGGVTWRRLGDGEAVGAAHAEALVAGPVVANAFTLTVIETPVSGWSGVINLLDADVGTALESDRDLRVRRELELSRGASGTADAIRAAILDLNGVVSCTVFVNDTDVTDGDGMPPHSVEALVRGGTDQDVFDALLANVAAGIQTTGNTDGTATDSSGTDHDESFSRPDEIEIYVTIDGLVTDDSYPTDGDDQVKAAIVAWGDAFATGRDVVANQVLTQIFTVQGVVDLANVFIGTAPSPGASTTIAIAPRELATFDTSRIVFSA